MNNILAAAALAAGFSRAAPPWRTLGMLAVLVLAAHTLVLRTVPDRFGPELDAASPRNRTTPIFITRSIEIPPPAKVVPPPAAPPAVQPTAKAPIKPKRPLPEGNEAVAAETSAQPAIDFAAPQAPDSLAGSEPPASSSAASAPLPTTDTAAATDTSANEPPAPAAPALPAGASQTPVTAMALPPSIRLAYKMTGQAKGMTYHANAELGWHQAGGSYDARITVSALFLGSRSMASSGQVGAEGLAPTRFSDKSRSEVAAHFEADKARITFSANTPAAPWIKGAQDRVSVFLQLGGMLAGSPASFPVGSSISLYTVGPRDADTWTFLVETEENVSLPFGDIVALKLTRQPRREYDQKVEIWYAPSLGYLPVRNKITQYNGDFVDQQLNTVNKF